jgi:hypothetical protein
MPLRGWWNVRPRPPFLLVDGGAIAPLEVGAV